MSNLSIYTEREMLKHMLECIQEDKKVLRGMYSDIKQQETDLLNRMRELDNMGREGTKGIYDVQSLISDLSETLSKVSELIPKIPIETVLDEIRKTRSDVVVLDSTENKVLKSKEYQQSKNDLLYKENQKAISKRIEKTTNRKFNAKAHGGELIEFMKDMGRPVSTNEIKEFLRQQGYAEGNTSNRMTAMMKKYPKISKVGHGFYQYRG